MTRDKSLQTFLTLHLQKSQGQERVDKDLLSMEASWEPTSKHAVSRPDWPQINSDSPASAS